MLLQISCKFYGWKNLFSYLTRPQIFSIFFSLLETILSRFFHGLWPNLLTHGLIGYKSMSRATVVYVWNSRIGIPMGIP